MDSKDGRPGNVPDPGAQPCASDGSNAETKNAKSRKPYTITKARERWSDDEHNRFLEAMKLHGRNWAKVAEHVGTKTTVQIRSHAQKYFNRLKKSKDSHGTSAFTSPDILPESWTGHGSAIRHQPLLYKPPAADESFHRTAEIVAAAATEAAAAAASVVVAAAGSKIREQLLSMYVQHGVAPEVAGSGPIPPPHTEASVEANIAYKAVQRVFHMFEQSSPGIVNAQAALGQLLSGITPYGAAAGTPGVPSPAMVDPTLAAAAAVAAQQQQGAAGRMPWPQGAGGMAGGPPGTEPAPKGAIPGESAGGDKAGEGGGDGAQVPGDGGLAYGTQAQFVQAGTDNLNGEGAPDTQHKDPKDGSVAPDQHAAYMQQHQHHPQPGQELGDMEHAMHQHAMGAPVAQEPAAQGDASSLGLSSGHAGGASDHGLAPPGDYAAMQQPGAEHGQLQPALAHRESDADAAQDMSAMFQQHSQWRPMDPAQMQAGEAGVPLEAGGGPGAGPGMNSAGNAVQRRLRQFPGSQPVMQGHGSPGMAINSGGGGVRGMPYWGNPPEAQPGNGAGANGAAMPQAMDGYMMGTATPGQLDGDYGQQHMDHMPYGVPTSGGDMAMPEAAHSK